MTINEKQLNEFLDEMMDLNDLPGLAVGVSIGNSFGTAQKIKTDFSKKSSYDISRFCGEEPFEYIGVRGFRNYGARTPLKPDDIFHCASVSKLFTSTAVLKLVEAGAFGLYDRLCDLMPNLDIKDERFREIRLWNMLTHTSGLGDVDDYHWDTYETGEDSLRRYVYGVSTGNTTSSCYDSNIAGTFGATGAFGSAGAFGMAGAFGAAGTFGMAGAFGAAEVLNQPMLWYPQVSPEFYGVPETDENGNPLVDEQGKPKNLFRYSNVAYEILGQLVAEYSDKMPDCEADKIPSCVGQSVPGGGKLSYEDFIARYLLEPAGMTSSTMKTFERCDFNSAAEREACGMASPHAKDDSRAITSVEFYPYTRYHAPSSTLTSNVGDLLKWGRAHLSAASGHCPKADSRSSHGTSGILQRETYDSIWRDYATVPNNGEKMGLGWFMRKQKVQINGNSSHEFTLFGHEGTDDGFRASFWICPELDLVTVVLSNLSGAPVKKINKKLFDIIRL